jgi:Ca-activated chloride channel family protein
LLLLIPALLYLVWVIFHFRQYNPWATVCDPHLLKVLIKESPIASRGWLYASLFIFYLVSVFALAGPAWKKAQLPIYRDVNSLMLVLDLSTAMQVDDIKPDRLSRAKYKIRDLINAAQNTQMGLVVFTNEAFTASPLSKDANTLKSLLDDLYPQMMPVAGSNIAEGLSQGLSLLQQAGAANGDILLITASDPSQESMNTAKTIHETGAKLDVLAMLEDNESNKAMLAHLKEMAAAGGGSLYQFTTDSADIQAVLNNLDTKQAIKEENVDNAFLWQDAGAWFCLLLLPVALIVLREKTRHEKN